MSVIDKILYSNYKVIGITGQAGAGKSFFSNIIKESSNFTVISSDYFFIGDSEYRKQLLSKKYESSLEYYIETINQYSWWNWDIIYLVLNTLINKKPYELTNIYNRETGLCDQNLILQPTNSIIYEGAILGSSNILSLLDIIIFVDVDPIKRLNRLIEKDKNRRTIEELLARFLITQKSEKNYYNSYLKNFKNIIYINDDFKIIEKPLHITQESNQFIPLPN